MFGELFFLVHVFKFMNSGLGQNNWSSVSQALFEKTNRGGNFFASDFFKQNLVWRKHGHDSLNKFFEAGWKKRMRQCLRNRRYFFFGLKYPTISSPFWRLPHFRFLDFFIFVVCYKQEPLLLCFSQLSRYITTF